MSVFTPLKAADAPQLRSFYEAQPYRLCDYTAGVAFMWRKFLKTAYCIHADMLLCRITLKAGDYFTFPIGNGNLSAALTFLEEYCLERQIPLRFAGVPEKAVPLILQHFHDRCKIKEWRDSADYLYDYNTFLQFPGRHLAAKRNHLRRFWKENPTSIFLPLQPEDVPRAVSFIQNFAQQRAATGTISAVEQEEWQRSCELLENMQSLGIKAGILQKDGNIIAVTAGEIVRDMLCVHVEKADWRYTGVYQAISNAFARYMATDGVAYINREDDAGDMGLRKSKLSYRPCALLMKYEITIE